MRMDLNGINNNIIYYKEYLQLAYYFTLTSRNHLIYYLSISIYMIYIRYSHSRQNHTSRTR